MRLLCSAETEGYRKKCLVRDKKMGRAYASHFLRSRSVRSLPLPLMSQEGEDAPSYQEITSAWRPLPAFLSRTDVDETLGKTNVQTSSDIADDALFYETGETAVPWFPPPVVILLSGVYPQLEALVARMDIGSDPSDRGTVCIRIVPLRGEREERSRTIHVNASEVVKMLLEFRRSVFIPWAKERARRPDELYKHVPPQLLPLVTACLSADPYLLHRTPFEFDADDILSSLNRMRGFAVSVRAIGGISSTANVLRAPPRGVIQSARCLHFRSALSYAARCVPRSFVPAMEEAYMSGAIRESRGAFLPPSWCVDHPIGIKLKALEPLLAFFRLRGAQSRLDTATDLKRCMSIADGASSSIDVRPELSFWECLAMAQDVPPVGLDHDEGDRGGDGVYTIRAVGVSKSAAVVLSILMDTAQFEEAEKLRRWRESSPHGKHAVAVEFDDRRIDRLSLVRSFDRSIGEVSSDEGEVFMVVAYRNKLALVSSAPILRGCSLVSELRHRLGRLRSHQTLSPTEVILAPAIQDALLECSPSGLATDYTTASTFIRKAAGLCLDLLRDGPLSPSHRRVDWTSSAMYQPTKRDSHPWTLGVLPCLMIGADAQYTDTANLEHRLFCRTGDSPCAHDRPYSDHRDGTACPATRWFDLAECHRKSADTDTNTIHVAVSPMFDPAASNATLRALASEETQMRHLCNRRMFDDWSSRWLSESDLYPSPPRHHVRPLYHASCVSSSGSTS